MSSLILWALAGGMLVQGALIIWVAPLPTQLRKEKPAVEAGSDAAFHIFCIDQYAWIGISLVVMGLLLGLFEALS